MFQFGSLLSSHWRDFGLLDRCLSAGSTTGWPILDDWNCWPALLVGCRRQPPRVRLQRSSRFEAHDPGRPDQTSFDHRVEDLACAKVAAIALELNHACSCRAIIAFP